MHDLLKQKQVLNGGKQVLSNQEVEALLPIHHQIRQEHRSVKEFIILVIVANTISTLILIGLIQICRLGMRYIANVHHEIELLRTREEDTAASQKRICRKYPIEIMNLANVEVQNRSNHKKIKDLIVTNMQSGRTTQNQNSQLH